jgi:hypothetical protein
VGKDREGNCYVPFEKKKPRIMLDKTSKKRKAGNREGKQNSCKFTETRNVAIIFIGKITEIMLTCNERELLMAGF